MANDYTPRFDLVHDQGTTFMQSFNWYGNGKTMHQIEDIQVGYPTHIKVEGHGLPSGSPTPVFLEGIEGEIEYLNTHRTGLIEATRIDDDWFEVPINTVGKEWDNNSGTLTYLNPTDLSGWTVSFRIQKKWHDPDPLHVASTDNGEVTVTTEDAAISIIIPASVMNTLSFSKGVWFLEVTNGSTVIRVAQGSLTNVLGDPR
jgi:hypothetical protein